MCQNKKHGFDQYTKGGHCCAAHMTLSRNKCYLLDMSHLTLLVFLTKNFGLSLRKGLNIDFHPGLILLSTGILSRMHFRCIVNAGHKKEGVGVHALNDWKNEILRIIDVRIGNFTKHRHLFSMEHLQREWLASRERLPFRTPGSVPLFCSNC